MFSRININNLEYKVIADKATAIWNFTIKDDIIYAIASTGDVNEADFPLAKLVKINIGDSEFKQETLDDENLGYNAGNFTTTDSKIYYNMNYDTFEYNLNENQANKKDRFGLSLQCLDNNVYSFSKNKINKYDTTTEEKSVVCNTIDNLEINDLSVSADAILFSTFDEANQLTYIYKYDFDTKETTKIYEYNNSHNSNFMYVIDKKVFIFNHRINTFFENQIYVIDLDGNLLWEI